MMKGVTLVAAVKSLQEGFPHLLPDLVVGVLFLFGY
jgi:hypothetical protein